MPGEPENWYGRFTEYLRLGSDRSIEEVWRSEEYGRTAARLANTPERNAKESKGKQKDRNAAVEKRRRPSRQWYENSAAWRWKQRAAAYDRHLRDEEEREWIQRRRAYRAERWELKEKLVTKVKGMLNFPLTQVRRAYDETDPETGERRTITQIIEPADWRLRDVVPLIRAMDLLMENDSTDAGEEPQQPDDSIERLGALLETMVSATYSSDEPPGTDPLGDIAGKVPGSGRRKKKLQDRTGEADSDNR